MKKRLSKLEDMSIFNDEYLYTPVTNVNEIPYICEISDKIMNVDRMILDEKLETKSAQKRYHLYRYSWKINKTKKSRIFNKDFQ